jgi:alpha/beta superfamily hydrolase
MTTTSHAFDETPVFFTAGDDTLFGVLTTPADGATPTTAVVLVAGGWHSTSADRNRTFVRVARELAQDGIAAFRFDYHGVGDSTGDHGSFRLQEPDDLDLHAALDWLHAQGFARFLLVGVCFGARTALGVANGRIDVEGVVLITMPVKNGGAGMLAVSGLAKRLSVAELARRGLRWSSLRQLVDPTMRRVFVKALRARLSRPASPRAQEASGAPRPVLAETVERQLLGIRGRVPVLLVYGEGEEEYVGYQRASRLDPSGVLSELPGVLDVMVGPVPIHGFARLPVQDEIVSTLRQWCAARLAAARSGGT